MIAPRAFPAFAVVLSLLLLGATPVEAPRKGIVYLMIQGGGLVAPVIVHHGEQPHSIAPLDEGGDPLLALVSRGFGPALDPAPEMAGRYYEVGEFLMYSDRVPLPGPSGMPDGPLRMEDADMVSRIYPDAPGGPVWNYRGPRVEVILHSGGAAGRDVFVELRSGTRAPWESSAPFRAISPDGQRQLESMGLVFGR